MYCLQYLILNVLLYVLDLIIIFFRSYYDQLRCSRKEIYLIIEGHLKEGLTDILNHLESSA